MFFIKKCKKENNNTFINFLNDFEIFFLKKIFFLVKNLVASAKAKCKKCLKIQINYFDSRGLY